MMLHAAGEVRCAVAGLDVVIGIPVSVKWLTTGGLMCTVSAKLLITEVSHGAGTNRVRAYSQIVDTWLVLISKVDCH